MRSRPWVLVVMLAIVLLVAGACAGEQTADTDVDDDTLCVAISAEELDSLSALQFAETPNVAGESVCNYGSSLEQEGPHTVIVSRDSERTIDERKGDVEGAVDLQIGEHAAFITTIDDMTFVYVELDDALLLVRAEVSGSAEGAGIDQTDYSLKVAEVAVTNLTGVPATAVVPVTSPEPATTAVLVTSPEPATTAEPITPLTLPEVDGIEWSGVEEGYGEALRPTPGVADVFRFGPLLEASGADYGQLGHISVNANTAGTDEQIGGFAAFRVSGVDEATLRPAVLAWMGNMFGSDDLPVETANVGGKDVLSVDVSPELHMYIHVVGDEFFLVNLPEADAARVFETLP